MALKPLQQQRLGYLQQLLAARTGPTGDPIKGYSGSVRNIRIEIASLTQVAAASADPRESPAA